MRTLLLILAMAAAQAEIIDRIALTIDNRVITESMLFQQIRLAAFYDNKAPDFSASAKRKAADTLISQILLIREMDDTRYPDPAMATVLEHVKETVMPRFANEEAYRKDLADRRLTEQDVLRFLQSMVRSLDFIDLRFRRGQQVSTLETADFYRKEFSAQWAKRNPGKPMPPLDQVSDDIEEQILAAKTDAATEEWLSQTRASARIRFREEVFQ
ncbi:MAG: hypothetical protein HY820_13940 [Acidobacteria bacterium]|nr:hypothetical protein [Acidobacteriota bacterium]